MNDECICKSQLNRLKNTHYVKMNIDLIVMTKKDDEGIVILENNACIACFDTKYCPMCGRELSEGSC